MRWIVNNIPDKGTKENWASIYKQILVGISFWSILMLLLYKIEYLEKIHIVINIIGMILYVAIVFLALLFSQTP